MTIATEKLLAASERYTLIRLEPARYVLPTSVGGGVYQATFPYPVSRVQRNGTNLTSVTSVSSNDEYSYNETTQTLQVKLASAPNDTSNVIVVFYYLFYTGAVQRSLPQTPTDSSTTIRSWAPRIQNAPSFFQSFSNVRTGILTIADSTLKILNPDREFQQYLTADDSFNNKRVEIWNVINDVENIQKVYDGTITAINIRDIVVSINIADQFNKLKQMAYMGDAEGEAVFTRESGSFPNLQPAASGRPCPYIIADSSQYESMTAANPSVSGFRLVASATKAYCTEFSETKGTSYNRVWGLCRSRTVLEEQLDITGLITAVTNLTGNVYRITSTGIGNKFFYIGDTFRFQISSVDYYAYITYVSGNFIEVATSNSAVPTTGMTHMPCPSMSLVIKNLPYDGFAEVGPKTLALPHYHRDYTVTSTATSGGNYYHEITFVNNFESNITTQNYFGGDLDILDPDIHEVNFRVSPAGSYGILVELRRILNKAGITTVNTDFLELDDTMGMSAYFHIPNIDEDVYDYYLKYVEDILSTTLCYLKVNTSGNTTIGAIAPPAGTSIRDSSLILDGSANVKIDYNDIVTDLVPYNPHLDPGNSAFGSSKISNNKSRYLHSVNNTDRFKHCALSFAPRRDCHIGLKSERAVTYSFAVATEDVDSSLGDDLTLDNKMTLGSSEETDIKIISLEKSNAKILVEASDLLGSEEV